MASYHAQLFSPAGASLYAYLTEERKLLPEMLKRFGLGAVVSPEESDESYVGRVAIPYLTPSGPVSLRFRAGPGSDHPAKYLQPKGTTLGLFHTWQVTQPEPWIAITEGEIDCITAVQCGIPTVGLPGVSSWKPHYRTIFAGYERVLILADADKAGDGFAEKLEEMLPDPKVHRLPDGEDVNSFYCKHGSAGLRDYLGLRKENQ